MLGEVRRGALSALVAAAVLALAPASAFAAGGGYCVPSGSIPNCPSGGVAEATIADALNAARLAGGSNSIYVGPGQFSESGLTDASGNEVDLVGDGYARTTLTSPLTVNDTSSTVSDLTIDDPGGTAITGGGMFVRDRITAAVGVDATLGPTFVDDSLISASGTAIEAPSGAVSLIARHDTLVGTASGATGMLCAASCAGSVDSTLFWNLGTALSTPGSGAITIFYSDLYPNNDAGSGISGSNNFSANPLLASTDPSSPLAFQLTTSSPAIDAGDPILGDGESSTDLAGAPRVVAGHFGGAPISDVGAFEYQPQEPKIVAVASSTRAQQGARVRFTATVTPVNPGDTITSVYWTFDDNKTANGSSVTHAFSTPGTHTGWATVTDLNGFEAESALVPVTIIAKPTASGSLSGLTSDNPVVHLTIERGADGARIKSFTVSLPAGLRVRRGHGRGGLKLSGGTAKVAGGELTVRLSKPAARVTLTLTEPLLVESHALFERAARAGPGPLRAVVRVTDATGRQTELRPNLVEKTKNRSAFSTTFRGV